MDDVAVITSSNDPWAFYKRYRELSERYDQAAIEVDTVRAQLENVDPNDKVNHKRLTARLNKLSNGHFVLLGWVSAYYAAYVFCLRGTETPFIKDFTNISAPLPEAPPVPEFWRAAKTGGQ